MTDNDIIKAGYYEYDPSNLADAGVIKCFQKLFKDENGKKYFIDIKKWKGYTHPHTGEEFPESYEFFMQLNYGKNDCPINFELFNGWTIYEVEEFAEKLFKTNMFKYYDEF